MKYCVCTDALYMGKADLPDATAEVKALGIEAYEFWFWWDHDLDVLKKNRMHWD